MKVPCMKMGMGMETYSGDRGCEISVTHQDNPNRVSALHDFESRLPEFEGRKFDQDKPDWSLLPLNLLTGIVKVLTFGAKKYARDNWMYVPDAKNRYSSALMRHFAAWQSGEKVDEETGLSHLHHIGCCLVFLIWFEENA